MEVGKPATGGFYWPRPILESRSLALEVPIYGRFF